MGVYDSPENAFEAADKKPEIGKINSMYDTKLTYLKYKQDKEKYQKNN